MAKEGITEIVGILTFDDCRVGSPGFEFGRFIGKDTVMDKGPFEELVDMLILLRGPNGCPWDKEQDHRTLERYVIEEAYEVVEAIERGDAGHLKEELGDLLLQVVFHAQIAREQDDFNIDEVLETLNAKLKRRHPHIFGEVDVSSPEEVKINWNKIKADEKREYGAKTLKGISKSLPSLLFAFEIQDKAAAVGFDWPEAGPVFDKIREEVGELEASLAEGSDYKAEVGDILFAIVNLCRHIKVDPEIALRRSAVEFDQRFELMEKLAQDDGATMAELTLEEQDKLWDRAKLTRRIK